MNTWHRCDNKLKSGYHTGDNKHNMMDESDKTTHNVGKISVRPTEPINPTKK